MPNDDYAKVVAVQDAAELSKTLDEWIDQMLGAGITEAAIVSSLVVAGLSRVAQHSGTKDAADWLRKQADDLEAAGCG